MPTATITSKGQVTLPKEIRQHLHVAEGDRVEFVIDPEGGVRIRPMSGSVRDLYGIVRSPRSKAPTLEEMDEAVGKYLAEEDSRIRKGEA